MERTTLNMKKKITVIIILFAIFFIALILRVGYWQIIKGAELSEAAVQQQTRDKTINSKRGSILDRNGNVLAASISVETITASPRDVKKNHMSISEIAQGLSPIIDEKYDDIYKKLDQDTAYVVVKKKVDKKVADNVRKFLSDKKISGFTLVSDTKRYYPFDNLAAHVIGFTGTDKQGLAGVELQYDKYLKGSSGRLVSAKDAAGGDMPFDYEKLIDPEDGLNVVLTIDENIQRIAEKYLEQALIDNKINNGVCCIIMDVKSGGILAMTTKPDFNLNDPFTITDPETLEAVKAYPEGKERNQKYSDALQKLWRNKAVVDSYEPGSTFKIFTASMAVEENVVSDNDTFYCGGSKHVENYDIHCWKAGGHGQQNFKKAVQNSCNPAFIEIGARVGREKFYTYMSGLGFREKTGIDLPGETIGLIPAYENFNEVELATSSFGQGFTITPIQMVTAVNAIANNGMMIKPHIIKRLEDQKGNVVKEFGAENVRQIVSESTSKKIKEVLESVVSEGSGSGAYIKGFRVGGKTGTSEKIPRGNGKYVASFVCMAPCDDPEVICLVMLDEPNGDSHFGGVIATPIARNIMEEVLNYLKVEPSYTAEELATMETTVPNVIGMPTQNAKDALARANLNPSIEGAGEKVLNQLPKAGVKVNRGSTVMAYTEETMKTTTTTVPNLLNMTVNDVATAVSNARLNLKIQGAGSTVSNEAVLSYQQSVPAGSVIEIGTTITVEFRRVEAGE